MTRPGKNVCAMSETCEGKPADHGLMCAECRADDLAALRPANSPGVAHVFSDEAGYLRMEGERDG